MQEQDFLRYFAQNARHLMWFLGAGTSRAAGLPTASDLLWDLKRSYYCTEENQDIKSHDINNKQIKSRIQQFMDSRGHPPLGSVEEYCFYFELLFGKDYEQQQRYIRKTLASEKTSITVGHRALSALLKSDLARLVFTTNFDEVVESSYAHVTGQPLAAFSLDGSYAALDALNAERFPIYAKIHGDFRYQKLKNLAEDLKHNDYQIKRCFIAAAARYGLVVSGYSGRDANVDAMFREAMGQNNAFPHGFFWTTPRAADASRAVLDLIEFARSKSIRAALVQTGTFDEQLSKIWRQIPCSDAALDAKVRSGAIAPTAIPLPPPGKGYPILRTNALLVSSMPKRCGVVICKNAVNYKDLQEKLVENRPDTPVAFTDRILYWGNNDEAKKTVDLANLATFGTFDFADPVVAMEASPFLKSFFENALSRAVCSGKPVKLRKRDRTYFAVVHHDAADRALLKPLADAVGFNGQPGKLHGRVTGLKDVFWAEAVSIRLEERNGQTWMLLRPDIWISPLAQRDEAIEFLRGKKIRRWNAQSSDILSAWIHILVGEVRSTRAVAVTAFAGDEQPATFEIHTRTAFSEGDGRGR